MTLTSSAPTSEPASADTVSLTLHTLDHAAWTAIQTRLRQALATQGLAALLAPTTLIVHDLLDGALKAMHREVFRQIMEADLGLPLAGQESTLETLYQTELTEHGPDNIAHACQSGGWQVQVSFPATAAPTTAAAGALLQVEVPLAWDPTQCGSGRLLAALGFALQVSAGGMTSPGGATGCRIVLARPAGHTANIVSPALLEAAAQTASLAAISAQLDYGLIHFSAGGALIAAAPSMLRQLQLDPSDDGALQRLAELIPPAFHNDVLWGLALADERGAFENYRIRVRVPDSDNRSILFNVSGTRDGDGVIRSLWQAVAQDAGGAHLAEGSMLSEVRIHNITRNYVPQLVERKAREAVRLGRTSIANEKRPVVILFCDIVGFTSFVEAHAASESVIDTLNSILRRVAGAVRRHNGSIDKFMGDSVMALFDAPADALRAALAMQGYAEDINGLRTRAGQQALQLRIGSHWGEVIIGNVGTRERLDWTAIGDVVNTASRIEKHCRPGAILVSRAVRDAVLASQPGQFGFSELFDIQVKGKRECLQVCHVTPLPPSAG
jgi:class 3 adenylate cyclase